VTALWVVLGLLAAVAVHDLLQTRHAILRNFPVLGHLRYILESIGPELRQYIVTGNNEERPFSRDQRRWVYASSKEQNNYFGFGTDQHIDTTPGYLILRHAAFPLPQALPGLDGYDPTHPVPCAKVLGAWRGREHAFRPASLVSVSAMSFGSLGARAVEAMNRGCAGAGALHNTGEGGIACHHDHGGGLIWQIGTGYFGARDAAGNFSLDTVVANVAAHDVRAIEIKLSQGAKPGMGGVLPGAKVTEEIAAIRGVAVGETVLSPAAHSAFSDVAGLIAFVESIADATGLPVGIKSAVGDEGFWRDLASQMAASQRGPDFIAIDGGEGGTGAGPLVFADHVALPFRVAISTVYPIFVEHALHDKVVFVGSGRIGFPAQGLLAMALGCDMIAVAREAMLSVGCIQAQKCHTGECPTGVATQSAWLGRGLDPVSKAARLAHYLTSLRKEMMQLSRACGVPHPALVTTAHFTFIHGPRSRSATDLYEYDPTWGALPDATVAELRALSAPIETH